MDSDVSDFCEILILLFDGTKCLKDSQSIQSPLEVDNPWHPGMKGSYQLGSSEVGGVGLSFGTSSQAHFVPAL